jgi:hypothetical protein
MLDHLEVLERLQRRGIGGTALVWASERLHLLVKPLPGHGPG